MFYFIVQQKSERRRRLHAMLYCCVMLVLCCNVRAELAIVGPTERAIYQRSNQNMARIPISGTFDGVASQIEARIVTRSGFGEESSLWQVIDSSPVDGRFSGSLPVAGGWYDLEVRSLNGAVQTDSLSIERVGVGEVFITAGQSNSANHGDDLGRSNPQIPLDDRVSAFDGNQWQFATDPQPTATGNSGSPWPAFGSFFVEQFDVPVGIMSVGFNGSHVGQWLPDADRIPGQRGPLYDRLRGAIESLSESGFRAVLWHQGETDNIISTPTAVYASNLEMIIAQSREDAGFDVPWGVALATYLFPQNPIDPNVVAGQLQVIVNDPHVFLGPNTDELVGPLRGINAAGVHFNSEGLSEHGRLWVQQIAASGIVVPEPVTIELGAFFLLVLGLSRKGTVLT